MTRPNSHSSPIGVVLINLGGPDSIEAVEPFLFNLFSDPDIITLPFGLQWMLPILASYISRRRSTVAKGYYRAMGGKSPIADLTEDQRAALEDMLRKEGDYRVFVGMRYWNPTLEEALEKIKKEGIRKVILFPLFPQFSMTSSGSGLNEWRRLVKKKGIQLETVSIHEWYSHPTYIDSLVENIEKGKKLFPKGSPEPIHILFSAHGIPEKVVRKGDPYQRQIEETIQLVRKAMGNDEIFHLAYQSKVGRLKWIGPPVEDKLKELAGQNVKKILAVPISFVSDHSETLYEIDILFKKIADELQIPYFIRMPSLNSSPTFIKALKEIVAGKSK
jgi:protoporphyrin/coproporphyrin ferrochelatase